MLCHISSDDSDRVHGTLSHLPRSEGESDVVTGSFPLADLFTMVKGQEDTFQCSQKSKDCVERLNREHAAPHLWVTLGKNVVDLGVLAGKDVFGDAEAGDPTGRGARWKVAVMMLAMMIDEADEANAEITVEWRGADAASKNGLNALAQAASVVGSGRSSPRNTEKAAPQATSIAALEETPAPIGTSMP